MFILSKKAESEVPRMAAVDGIQAQKHIESILLLLGPNDVVSSRHWHHLIRHPEEAWVEKGK